MNYCGIIAEFNPFTNGHEYLIQQAKKQTGLDVVCIMSGNFVQRGELAILEKHKRAEHAIKAGAIMVLELPVNFALSGAPYFAEGGVYSLSQLDNISHLAFGVELEETDELMRLAKFKVNENKEIKNKINEYMKNGNNYSVASFKAYTNNIDTTGFNEEFINKVFNSPNNILALEYLTAIYKLKLNITPVFVKRLDNGYNSKKPKKVKIEKQKINFAGASYIREKIFSGKIKKTKKLLPEYSYNSLKEINPSLIKTQEERLSALTLDSIRSKAPKTLQTYYDYNESLASLISNNASKFASISEITNNSIGKSYRKSRLKKLLLFPTLNLTKEKAQKLSKPTEIIALAIKKSKKKDLNNLINNSKIKLIISQNNRKENENSSLLILTNRSNQIYEICSLLPYKNDLTIFID